VYGLFEHKFEHTALIGPWQASTFGLVEAGLPVTLDPSPANGFVLPDASRSGLGLETSWYIRAESRCLRNEVQ
jgi:hypothetical protein